MDGPGSRGDSRFSLGSYGMSILSGDTAADMYGNPGVSLGAVRPGTSLQQMSPRGHASLGGGCAPRGMKGSPADMCYEVPTSQGLGGGLDSCGVPDVTDDSYGGLQAKKSPPSNGKKTKGRVKIKMEYIENKLRRYTTFSKRKTGIMKKVGSISVILVKVHEFLLTRFRAILTKWNLTSFPWPSVIWELRIRVHLSSSDLRT